ncbi:hypothetical protein BD769DRAFT_1456905 [Suillus cothurnatus]|nr:hypothetical protein BD769DRAFT_1456905 [Suillus cothurnatus]
MSSWGKFTLCHWSVLSSLKGIYALQNSQMSRWHAGTLPGGPPRRSRANIKNNINSTRSSFNGLRNENLVYKLFQYLP